VNIEFYIDVNNWLGSTHDCLLLGLSYKIHFSSSVMNLRNWLKVKVLHLH